MELLEELNDDEELLELGAEENVSTNEDVFEELLEEDELLEEMDNDELEELLDAPLELEDEELELGAEEKVNTKEDVCEELLEEVNDELELGLEEKTNTNGEFSELELNGEERVRIKAEDPDVGAVVVASLLEELGADGKVRTKDDV